jgi:hypothetical protein
MMLKGNLIYTDITYGKRLVIVVGQSVHWQLQSRASKRVLIFAPYSLTKIFFELISSGRIVHFRWWVTNGCKWQVNLV